MELAPLTFKTGNTRIIVMENYEALGRYTAAKDHAENYLRERDSALRSMKSIAETSIANGSASGIFGNGFDVPAAEESLKRATEAHHNLLAAIDEANRNADDCGKPKLKLWDR